MYISKSQNSKGEGLRCSSNFACNKFIIPFNIDKAIDIAVSSGRTNKFPNKSPLRRRVYKVVATTTNLIRPRRVYKVVACCTLEQSIPQPSYHLTALAVLDLDKLEALALRYRNPQRIVRLACTYFPFIDKILQTKTHEIFTQTCKRKTPAPGSYKEK